MSIAIRRGAVTFLPRAISAAAIFLSCTQLACSSHLSSAVETDASLATMDWLDQHYGIENQRGVNKLFARITERLASTFKGRALERESFRGPGAGLITYNWQVYVLRSGEMNAFSVGSGIIFVTEGLLARLDNESQLAAVIAHEMSHQLLGHTRDAIEAQAHSHSSSPASSPAVSYSLDRELDADSLSLKILKVARYDLRSSEALLSLGYREYSGSVSGMPPEWLVRRSANLEQQIQASGAFLPATENSREFTRVKHELFG